MPEQGPLCSAKGYALNTAENGVFGPQYPSLYEQLLAKRELRETEVMYEGQGRRNVLRQLATKLGRNFDADLASARAKKP